VRKRVVAFAVFAFVDGVAALPMLLAYLVWDFGRVARGEATLLNLTAVTCLSLAPGVFLRLFYRHLPPLAAKVYARSLIALAGVLLALDWIGPSMLVVVGASPILVLGLGDWSDNEFYLLSCHALYFIIVSFLSHGRIPQEEVNDWFGMMLVILSFMGEVVRWLERLSDTGAPKVS